MQRAAEEGRKTSGDDVLGVTQRCCRRERKLEKLCATKSGAAGRVVSISKKTYTTVLFGESFVAGTQKKSSVIDTPRAPQAFVGSTRRRRKGTGTRALCCSTQLQPHSVAPPSPNNHAGRYNMWKASGGEARKEKMRSIHPPLPLLRLFHRLLT